MNLRFFLVIVLFILNSCGQAGWKGYYKTYPDTTIDKYIADSSDNTTKVVLSENNKVDLGLPRECDDFFFAGIITPFTPPIPFFWIRSWSSAGKNGDGMCHYFIAETRPAAKVQLKLGNKMYEPKELEGLYGYTKYIFPVRAKNIDSGSILIEQNGEKIEVPFEYKYFKFWY